MPVRRPPPPEVVCWQFLRELPSLRDATSISMQRLRRREDPFCAPAHVFNWGLFRNIL